MFLLVNYRKLWTYCMHGHEFNQENTIIDNDGRRRCKICKIAKKREWDLKNKDHINRRQRDYLKVFYKKKRIQCLTYYGNGKLQCVCCGENTYEFLTLGHIHDNGQEERKLYGNQMNIILRLIKLGFPEGYETVCWNCNLGKRSNKGTCPHKSIIQVPVEVKSFRLRRLSEM